jgi:hypothetical protein
MRPHDQELAQVTITAFGDTEQPFSPATGVLSRYQPQPGCQVAAILENIHIADISHKRCGRELSC